MKDTQDEDTNTDDLIPPEDVGEMVKTGMESEEDEDEDVMEEDEGADGLMGVVVLPRPNTRRRRVGKSMPKSLLSTDHKKKKRKMIDEEEYNEQNNGDDGHTSISTAPPSRRRRRKVIKTMKKKEAKKIKDDEEQEEENDDKEDNDQDESEDDTVHAPLKKKNPRERKMNVCEICGYSTARSHDLKRHMKRHERAKNYHCCEPGCETMLETMEQFDTHLTKEHGKELEVIHKTFSNVAEFNRWMDQIREEDCAQYSRRWENRRIGATGFVCSRSVVWKKKKSNGRGIRKTKVVGTIVSNNICSSRIYFKKTENGGVEVTYHRTHTGHELDPRMVRLSKAQKEFIAQQLALGITREEIRKNFMSREIATRKDNQVRTITLEDIDNVRKNRKKAGETDFGGGADLPEMMDTEMEHRVDFDEMDIIFKDAKALAKRDKKAAEILWETMQEMKRKLALLGKQQITTTTTPQSRKQKQRNQPRNPRKRKEVDKPVQEENHAGLTEQIIFEDLIVL